MSYDSGKYEAEDLVVVIGQESRHFLIPENDPELRKERKQGGSYRFVPVGMCTAPWADNSFLAN